MRQYLPFIVIGLTTGAVYAIAALGLVLTYRTSGVFNFAHGAIGMFAAYMFYSLRQHLPTAVALFLAVLVIAPLMGVVIDRVLLRRLEGAPAATYIVTSLGLLVALQGAAVAIYGAETRRIAPFFPTSTFRLPGVNVGIDQAMVVAVAIAAGALLIGFFRVTKLGLQTRAVVDDPGLTGLTGVNPSFVTATSWMLGCSFAALAGVLFAPFTGLDSVLLTLLVVEAFGAAVVARLRSFPVTAAAAFGIALVQSLLVKIVGGRPSLVGFPSAIPFLVLLGVLVFAKPGSFQEVTGTVRASVQAGRINARRGRLPIWSLLSAVVAAAVAAPFLSGARIVTLGATSAFVLVFISLSLLVGLSRQVSLAHAIFVALGATNLAHLLKAGVPYLLALPLAALLLVPLGALMAFPALRLSGLYLALATFGFGVLAQNLLYPTGFVFGGGSIVFIPRPSFLRGDLAFYYFCLAVVALGVLSVEALRVSRLGRILTALSDSPVAVQSPLGISPLASRVITFCLSAFLAGIGGALLGSLVESVNNRTYNSFHSLVWLTVLMLAGARTFGGSLLAAVLLVAVPNVVTSHLITTWQPIAFGVGAIVLAQAPNGLAGLFRLPDFAVLAAAARPRLESRRSLERYLRSAGTERLNPGVEL